jgi:Fe-S oxidoreductase
MLLFKLGYDVKMIEHPESGRAAFSKGFLKYAQKIANKQIDIFSNLISDEEPLIGVEPSAILSFRDEYPRIVSKDRTENSRKLAEHTFCFEEFLFDHFMLQSDPAEIFNSKCNKILLHGHCHQKSLTDISKVAWLLSLPENYTVELIPSGCCGMAGAFGYEEEHFDVSQKISNITLLPAISEKKDTHKVAASGVSCRHQIHDLSSIDAFHTIDLLYEAIDWDEDELKYIL